AGPHVAGTPGNAVSQITPKPITASGIDGIDRVYDGTTGVGLDAAGASLTGVVAGDTVNLATTSAVGTLANKNIGVNKAVSITGLALTGGDQGNYTVSDASGATATISARSITSTVFAGVGRVYDGTTAVAVNGSGASLGGVIAGDTVGIAGGATGTLADKNVGAAKPVTITGVALDGADAGNYTVTDASNATVNITPLAVQATGITAVNRADNGSTAVGLNTAGAGVSGVLPGDTVGVDASGAVGSVATPAPGE